MSFPNTRLSREYIPQSRIADLSSFDPQNIKSIRISNLSEIRNQVSIFVRYSEPRKQILELFQGTTDQSWFVFELIQSFQLILPHVAGLNFIHEICKKISFVMPELNNALINNALIIFLSNSLQASQIFLSLYNNLTYQDQFNLAQIVFPICTKINSPNKPFKKLLRKLILICRDYKFLLEPLYSINYFKDLNTIYILKMQIEEIFDDSAARIIFDNFEFCISSFDYFDVVNFLFMKANQIEIRNEIFDRLTKNHKNDFLKDPQWRVFRTIALDGDLRQREIIASILEETLDRSARQFPPFYDQILVSVLFSLPLSARVEFLKRNEKKLIGVTYMAPFSMLLQYQEEHLAAHIKS
ncbi:hypothetical protein TRFO_40748 [Tritrichomonas foetus]|uniref:Uncharacterized protein n=1 Tax=Tritrichomonas foetus TaxID=1144522 RepID=A0A1J4J2F4_9EUKA|nr:hypothetical protein TRFO_40748 [Tritrichomonas foetus]|eukprot:OHS92921.1 hypothetical protein TRFO_40748 [Tritrichomonas foetus]